MVPRGQVVVTGPMSGGVLPYKIERVLRCHMVDSAASASSRFSRPSLIFSVPPGSQASDMSDTNEDIDIKVDGKICGLSKGFGGVSADGCVTAKTSISADDLHAALTMSRFGLLAAAGGIVLFLHSSDPHIKSIAALSVLWSLSELHLDLVSKQ